MRNLPERHADLDCRRDVLGPRSDFVISQLCFSKRVQSLRLRSVPLTHPRATMAAPQARPKSRAGLLLRSPVVAVRVGGSCAKACAFASSGSRTTGPHRPRRLRTRRPSTTPLPTLPLPRSPARRPKGPPGTCTGPGVGGVGAGGRAPDRPPRDPPTRPGLAGTGGAGRG